MRTYSNDVDQQNCSAFDAMMNSKLPPDQRLEKMVKMTLKQLATMKEEDRPSSRTFPNQIAGSIAHCYGFAMMNQLIDHPAIQKLLAKQQELLN